MRRFLEAVRPIRPCRRLAILRIHKTASQSFRDAYARAYGLRKAQGPAFGYRITPEDLESTRLLSPHMSFASWRELDPVDDWVVAITMREPLRRLRSVYHYFRGKSPDHPTGVGLLLRNQSYLDFLRDERPEVLGLKDNILVRFAGGARFGVGDGGRNKLYLPDALPLASALDAALDAFERRRFHPLVLERGEQSMKLLNASIRYPGEVRLRHLNRTRGQGKGPGKKDLYDPDTAKEIAALEARWTEFDWVFYSRIVRELDKAPAAQD